MAKKQSPPPPPGLGKKYICVTIDENGDTEIELVGYAGGSCVAASRLLEEKLGKVVRRDMKCDDGGHQFQGIKKA